jgi:hypothetical protein
VAAVYTPKDFELNRIMTDLVRIVEETTTATTLEEAGASIPAR